MTQHIAFSAQHRDHPIVATINLGYPEGTTDEQMSDMMLQLMFRVLQEFQAQHRGAPSCCGGGPQWGHTFECENCPDGGTPR